MLYASKRFLVDVERVEQEGQLLTVHGEEIPIRPNDIIATDQYGVQFVMTDKYFTENYIAVRKMKHVEKKTRKSPFEEMYSKQLMEFGSLPNSEEDQEYINGTLELSKNKAF